MAATVEGRMHSEKRSPTAHPNRSPTEIRFSDVANYVGLSLSRDPSQVRSTPKLRHRSVPIPGKSPGSPPSPTTEPLAEPSNEGELPPIQAGRSERLRCQLEWLKAEQRAEKEQLHRLEASLSDSLLLEKKAQRRAAKHREQRDFHQQRAVDVEQKISRLREELEAREQATKTVHVAPYRAVRGGPQGSLSPQHEQGRRSPKFAQLVQAEQVTGEADVEEVHQHKAMDDRQPATDLSASSRSRMLALGAHEREGIAARPNNGQPGQGSPAPVDDFGAPSSDEEELAQSGSMTLKEYLDAADAIAQTRSVPSASPTATRAEVTIAGEPMMPQHPYSDDEMMDIAELKRETIREELIRVAGGDREAFKGLDLNRSGHISSQEFADGVARLGVKWTELTGLKRPRDLFKLFDQDKDGIITFKELFPFSQPREMKRMTTPEFVGYWIRRNRDFENLSSRNAKWQPTTNEEKLKIQLQEAQFRDDVAAKKKWMSSTIRRLKTRGKSDARCREIVALHLPKGTGSKDREGVPTFSEEQFRSCKKSYTDGYMDPIKRIQKVVGDLKEQKRDVRIIREELFMVSAAKLMQQRVEEDRKQIASSIAGLSILAKVKDPLVDDESKAKPPAKKSFKTMADEYGIDEDVVSDLCREFLKFADSNELLGRKGFTRLLQVLCPTRTLVDSDMDAWWGQITRSIKESPSKASAGGSRRNQCDFGEFVGWFSTSEARSV
mmetsp:Transcript_48228/g.134039  ORF Transcript_48228/g.134039 Transcript_48228/m.134039 type:complete len:723 (-) Transcript_48228:32-2200(-)